MISTGSAYFSRIKVSSGRHISDSIDALQATANSHRSQIHFGHLGFSLVRLYQNKEKVKAKLFSNLLRVSLLD